MKKNKIITSVLAMALVLIAVILIVITVGLFKTTKEETLEGQAETTDYRLSSKVPSRVLELRVKEGDFVHTGCHGLCRKTICYCMQLLFSFGSRLISQ